MGDVTIGEAGEGDIPVLARLMDELGYPTPEDAMRRRFEGMSADPSYATLIAERKGEVVGMAGIHIERYYEKDGSCVRILSFVVDSEHRGQGVGRALISAAESWAKRRGARDMMLTTHKRRAGAHEFYSEMGYQDTGYRFYKVL